MIENPSKSEVIGRCGGDGQNRMTTQNRQRSNAKKQLTQTEVGFYGTICLIYITQIGNSFQILIHLFLLLEVKPFNTV